MSSSNMEYYSDHKCLTVTHKVEALSRHHQFILMSSEEAITTMSLAQVII